MTNPSINLLIFFIWFIPNYIFSQIFPKSPEPWREEYNISLEGFEFQHPMTIISKDEEEIIKDRITNNIEPQKSAYLALISEANAQLSFSADPPSTMDIMGGYEPNSNLGEIREWLWRNCHAAYTCALAYKYSGEISYAAKASEILMDWANKATTFTGADRGLQLGSWFSPMLYAADLLYDYAGWTELERITFKSWWRTKCLEQGDVLNVMRTRDNNWKDAGLLGVFSASIVLEDTLLLKEAIIQLKSYFYSRTDDYVRFKGKSWKIKKQSNFVYLPREVIRNDGRSGLTYTAYALTTMVQCFEIARYAGFNFWHQDTQEGANIKDVIDQYFEWDIKNEPFPWNSNPSKSTKRRNFYELANSFLNPDPELKTFVKANWPLINGREGDEYATLNKGDITGTGIAPPLAPSNLEALSTTSKQIELNWKDNSDDELGFSIERKTDQASYFTIANVEANVISFTDKLFLNDSTTYTYRIKAFGEISSSQYSNEALASTIVSLDNNLDSIPEKVILFQNYPNPFNPTTKIRYTLPSTGNKLATNVKLIVYNILGKRVAILVNEKQQASDYEVEFDATGLTSGIYFYRITTDNFINSKIMILMK